MSGNSTPRKGTPINNPIKRKLYVKSCSSSSHDLLSPINTLDSKLPARKFDNPVPEKQMSLPPRKYDNPLVKKQPSFPLRTDNLPGAYVKAESSSDLFKSILDNYPKGTFTTENDEKEALTSFTKKHVNILSDSEEDKKAVNKEVMETFEQDTFDNDFDISAYLPSPKKPSKESKDLASLNVPLKSFMKPRSYPSLKVANVQYRSMMLPPTRYSHDFRDLQLFFVTKERYFSLSAFVNDLNVNIIVNFVKISRIQFIAHDSLPSGDWYIDFVMNSNELNFEPFGVVSNHSTAESLAFEECNTLRINLDNNCGMSKDSIENLLFPMLRDRNALQISQKRDPYGEFEKTASPKKQTPIRSLQSSGTIRAVPSLESLASSESVKISPSAVKRTSNSIFQSSTLYSPDVFDSFERRTSKRLRAKTSPEKRTFPGNSEDSVYIDPDFESARVVLFTYPEGELDSVYVTSHELERLSPGIWLNDTNIDFELKYLLGQLETSLQDKIHIFSSFFYRRLSSAKLSLSPSQDGNKTGYDMVKSWTRKINLFEKDFIVVPINENLHWFLAIICHPSKMLADLIECETKTKNGDDEKKKKNECDEENIKLSQEPETTQMYVDLDPEPIESTKIYIFDSLGLASRGKGVAVINRLRTYLQLEAEDKLKRASSKSACTGHVVKVPQQENYTDCGCFLLQFAEEFLKGIPAGIDSKISEQNNDMSNWFPSCLAQSRREVMRKRVEQLAADFAQREKIKNDLNPKPTSEIEDRSSDIEEIIMLPPK